MQITTKADAVTVVLEGAEVELFRMVLRRATFEDTPPGQQRQILELANELLRGLDAAAEAPGPASL